MTSEWVNLLVEGQGMHTCVVRTRNLMGIPWNPRHHGSPRANKHLQEVTGTPSREGYGAVASVLYHRPGSNPLCSYVSDDTAASTKVRNNLQAPAPSRARRAGNRLRWGISEGSPGTRRPTQ